MLEHAGLIEAMAPSALSGGQRMLLSLIGGFCSDAGLLVLDEPSNHLDGAHRTWLQAEMARWRERGRGLLLITHDRTLLANVDRTIETRPPALHRYGGGWNLVQAQRDAHLQATQARLEHAKVARMREQSALRDQVERAARKNARGARERNTGSQSKLMLDAMRDRADRSNGALVSRQAQRQQELKTEVSDAFAALEGALQQPEFPQPNEVLVPPGQEALAFDEVLAPWAWSRPFTWSAHGPVRVAITGPNHCLPLLEQFERRTHGISEGRLRQYLAKVGLGAERLRQPCHQLSGGEQMRAALLLAMLGQPPARMLLLDEPTNHLDLAASEALEHMLRTWTGALVVV
jgi:ATPase subunit of ABC transporter with duplicated ATPase domains